MTPQKLQVAKQMYDSRKHTVAEIADAVGVSRASIYRHLTSAKRGDAGASDIPTDAAAS